MEPRSGSFGKVSGVKMPNEPRALSVERAFPLRGQWYGRRLVREVSVQVRESGVQRVGMTASKRLRVALFHLSIVISTLLQVIVSRLRHGPRHARWDFRYEYAATMLRNLSLRVRDLPVPELRRYLLPSRIPPSLRENVRHELGSFSGLYAETFTPNNAHGARTLLFFHGGGYFFCSPTTHRDLASRLAVATAARTIAVDYRKAPEHPYPAGIDDCEQAYRALLAEGVPAEQIILAGDSAGGGLVLAVLLRVRDAQLPLPGSAILLSPWCDLTRSGASIHENAVYDYLDPEGLDLGVELYLQGQDAEHPHVTHVRADLRGLPPLCVITGDAELFYSENVALVAQARAQGVSVNHLIEPGRVHVSALLASLAPSAASSFAHIEAFVAAQPVAAQRPAIGAAAG
jgi:epsilon-lactone hydrolase